jgi:molybdopterin converting factor small subunit
MKSRKKPRRPSMPDIEVRLPQPFRGYLGGVASVTVEAATVAAALAALSSRSKALGDRLLMPDGSLRRFVNLYRNDEDVRALQGLDTPLDAGSILMVVVAVAGG